MHISRVNHTTAAQARGVTIVIDVIRAFTVAGHAFARGAQTLWLVRDIEEALALRERVFAEATSTEKPPVFLAGEHKGKLIPGFDFNNSPAYMSRADVQGGLVIQRTGAGTQGAVAVAHTPYILLCALTNAQATAAYARTLATKTAGEITLFPTGSEDDFAYGSEDIYCADYVEALLEERGDTQQLLEDRIAQLRASIRFELWQEGDADFPAEDIPTVLDVDRFHFAMLGIRKQWHDITYIEVQRINV